METTGSCVVIVQEAAAVVGLETEVTWFAVIVATGAVQVHVVLGATIVAVGTTLTGIDTAGAGGRSRTVCTAGAAGTAGTLLLQFLLAPFKFLRQTSLLQFHPISFLFLQILRRHWLLLLWLLLFLLLKLLLLLFLLKLLWLLLLLLLKLLWMKLLLLQLLWQLLLTLCHLLTHLTAAKIKPTPRDHTHCNLFDVQSLHIYVTITQ